MNRNHLVGYAAIWLVGCGLASGVPAQAASEAAAKADSGNVLEEIVITGAAAKVRQLDVFTPTASRLGLSAKETPATIDSIDFDQMQARGLVSVDLAVDQVPGAVSGGSPGDPAEVSMRGFTGNQVTTLHNGLYVGPSLFINRPGNTFNLASIEVLKGPASVLYGAGAIGGVINTVSKGPSWTTTEGNYLASAGSFGTTVIGVGYTTQLGEHTAIRVDFSRTGTEGYVHDTPANSTNGTVTVAWRPSQKLDVQLTVDYLTDNPSRYFGTPLVTTEFATQPLTGVIDSAKSGGQALDRRMQFVNYNTADGTINSSQIWPQGLVKWSISDSWQLEDSFYYFHANREWRNSESYSFNPSTNLIDRDRFEVLHDQSIFGNQVSLTNTAQLHGMTNKLVLGLDYSHLQFNRHSGGVITDSVDPFNPSPGLVGPPSVKLSQTSWDDPAVFAEDLLNVTKALKLIVGARYDQLAVTRRNYRPDGTFNTATSFNPTWHPFTWRAGIVYDITPNLTPYVSYTTGTDPVGSSLFTVSAGQNFGLSHSYQLEAGLKGSTDDHRGDFTVSVYEIKRSNIFLDGGQDAILPIGYEKSRGVEAAADIKLLPNWTVSANAAYTDAYLAPSPDLPVTYAPPNVPAWSGNVWTSVTNIGGVPLEMGGGVRYIGSRQANLPNNITLDSYALVNVYTAYKLSKHTQVTGRVNNALNKAYANWVSIFYPSEVMLGTPRTYELAVSGTF